MSVAKGILFVIFAFHATLFFAPSIPPIDDVRRSRDDPVILERTDFVGALAPNNKLDAFETLSTEVPAGTSFGSLKGPESFAVKDNYIYTGIHGGEILRIPTSSSSSSWQFVYKHGLSCTEQHQESLCGRPLGMRFDQGQLWVADAVYGLYRVDVEKGTAKVMDSTPGINSLALSEDKENGVQVYYTVASTRFPSLSQGLLELLSAPSGQVLHYDTKTNKREVILEGLSFANGIAVGGKAKETFLVVSDLGHSRLLKVDLKKKKAFTTFATTPGMVDNISSNGKGGFICAVIQPLASKFDLYTDLVLPYPMFSRYLLRLDFVVRSFAQFVLPSPTKEKFLYWMTNFETFSNPSYGLIVEYSSEGVLVKSWHSPAGKVAGLSEANLVGKHLYLGSPFNPFVGRVAYE